MKNLLSMFAVSTLVSTNASNLKPLFTNSVISHGFKSNQLNNKDISIKKQNKNNSNPFIPKQLPSLNKQGISSLAVDSSGNIYAGTTSYGLLKSIDGRNSFSRIDNNIKMDFINKIIFDNHNNIWVACDNGLYKSTDGIKFEQVKGIPNWMGYTLLDTNYVDKWTN